MINKQVIPTNTTIQGSELSCFTGVAVPCFATTSLASNQGKNHFDHNKRWSRSCSSSNLITPGLQSFIYRWTISSMQQLVHIAVVRIRLWIHL